MYTALYKLIKCTACTARGLAANDDELHKLISNLLNEINNNWL